MRMSKKIKEHPLYWPIKLYLKRLSGRELWLHPDVRIDTCSSDDWQFCPKFLDQNSVVYSLGVGDSIIFDLKIIKNCGSTVHAFDPTPFSVEWIKSQALPRQFVFHQWAIADSDGVIRMTRRVSRKGKKSKVMWTSMLDNAEDPEIIEVPCFTLQTIMKKLNQLTILFLIFVVGAANLFASEKDVTDKVNQFLNTSHLLSMIIILLIAI